MPLSEREISEALENRKAEAHRVIDRWGSQRQMYSDWQDSIDEVFRIYRGEWTMVWPDGKTSRVDPAVPNMLRLAAEDRARTTAATIPTIVCHPEGPGDDAREKADKLERITSGHLARNRINGHQTQMWAHDTMAGGLTVCKVWTDFTKPAAQRFPEFTRLLPQLSYPDPVFTAGPYLDSFIYSYEDYRRTVEKEYDVQLDGMGLPWAKSTQAEKVRVIEYYDDTWAYVVIHEMNQHRQANSKSAMVVQAKHGLGKCPVVIGARPTMDGTYSGEFNGGLGVLETWHQLTTMMVDDASRKTYPERVVYNIVNPEDTGPDATIQKETADGQFEYVQQPNQPFSNLQIQRDLGSATRTSFILPPSRSGDPNESIISAAGVNANQGQYNEDVRSIQQSTLVPMLEAALDVALTLEEVWSPNATKNIAAGKGSGYKETYVPSRDIKGYRNVQLSYGPMGSLDPLNQAVLLMQWHGNGGMSTRRTLELNPMIEDPQREEKQMLREQIQNGQIAGLLQRAAQGTLDPYVLALLDEAVKSDEVSLSEAIMALVPPAPQQPPAAAPVGTAPGATPPGAPGIPGAAEGPNQSNDVTAALA